MYSYSRYLQIIFNQSKFNFYVRKSIYNIYILIFLVSRLQLDPRLGPCSCVQCFKLCVNSGCPAPCPHLHLHHSVCSPPLLPQCVLLWIDHLWLYGHDLLSQSRDEHSSFIKLFVFGHTQLNVIHELAGTHITPSTIFASHRFKPSCRK